MTEPLWSSLPRSWRRGKVKHLASVTLGKMLQGSDSGGDTFAPYLRAANIQPDGVLDLKDVKKMWFNDAEVQSLDLQAGDVVVVEGGQGGYGRAAFLPEGLGGFGFQNSVNRLRPRDHTDGRFLNYYLIALRASGFIRAHCNVVSMPHLTQEKLAVIPVPVPPPDEQRSIADYLDRETDRIDDLIAEQERLIRLLHRRRQNLVARAVLGDRNPFNPPVDRPFTAIGYRYTVVLGKMLDGGREPRAEDSELPYIRAANIQGDGLHLDDVNQMPFSPEETRSLDLRAGDLLAVEGGAVGTCVVLSVDMPGWSFQKTVNRVRPKDDWSTKWLAYVLLAYRDAGVIDIVCNKSTIPHLTAEKLRRLRVPDEEPAEQRRIARLLDAQTTQLDALIHETEGLIDLARERRSALITAAVTGQIHVGSGS